MLDKESLIKLLTEGVEEAYKEEPDALGVVLFGSRSRSEWHLQGPRTDSDVDLSYICRMKRFPNALSALEEAIDRRLKPLGLRQDNTTMFLVESLRKKVKGPSSCYLEALCMYFDADSVVITVDPRLTQGITAFIQEATCIWDSPDKSKFLAERYRD